MRSRRIRSVVGLLIAGFLTGATAGRLHAEIPEVELTVGPKEATVGQRLRATLTVRLPSESTLEPPAIGPRLGPFAVYGGTWIGPIDGEDDRSYRWLAELSAFETGELEIPAIRLAGTLADGEAFELVSEPIAVSVTSVLDEPSGEEAVEIAEIKPPVSVPGNYRPLWIALFIVGLLAAVAAVLWWLQRRYAQRLAAVPVDDDAFSRVPPHEWVYQELKKLLEARLAEQGEIDRFYGELSRILKRYLEGRYRVDLMEHTTEEVAPSLEQAGTSVSSREKVVTFLEECDRVKFARVRPDAEAWRRAIERVYDIVDTTKPVEPRGESARRGVA